MSAPIRLTIIRISFTIISLIGIFVICNSDKSPYPIKYPLGNKLLYVEDIDGKGGAFSHQFGDIVLFDPITKSKNTLTNDRYYDTSPTYLKNDSVIFFLGGRDPKQMERGLGNPLRIYTLNMNSGKIEAFGKDIQELSLKKYDQVISLSRNINSIIFSINRVSETGIKTYKYDFTLNTTTYLGKTNKVLFHSLLSNNGDKLIYNIGWWREQNEIIIYDLKAEKHDTIKSSSTDYNLEDIRNDTLIIISAPRTHLTNVIRVQFYDIQNKKVQSIIEDSSEILIKECRFGSDKTVYYLKEYMTSDNKRKTDVFSYDWSNNQTVQLTNDGHDKHSLFYIPIQN